MEKTREKLLIENEELRTKLMLIEIEKNIYASTGNELSESMTTLEIILNGISEGIFLMDKDFKILWANNALLNSIGYKIEEVTNNYCYKLTHDRNTPCSVPDDVCPVAEVMTIGKEITVTHTHYEKNGGERFVEITAYPVKDKKGEIKHFVHVSRDITNKMRFEKTLKAAEARYRAVFDAIAEALFLCDPQTLRIIDVNDKGRKMFHYLSYDDMVTIELARLFDSHTFHDKETALSLLKKIDTGKAKLFEWLAEDSERRLFWVRVEARKILINQDERLLIAMHPLTGRQVME